MVHLSVAVTSVMALGASACNPMAYVNQMQIQSLMSPFFISHTKTDLAVQFKTLSFTGSSGKNVGFSLSSGDKTVATGVCKLVTDGNVPGAIGFYPTVTCPIPPLAVGTYSLSISGDASCGAKSYWKTDDDVQIIEPAHLKSVTPEHGPEQEMSEITLTGTNIGGPHVACEFYFQAGPGAKLDGSGNPLGCSMSVASYPATSVSKTSVTCRAPKWPGPMQQCGGKDGCHPLEGAVCDRKVRVAVSNDALVHSPEPIFFSYDSKTPALVV